MRRDGLTSYIEARITKEISKAMKAELQINPSQHFDNRKCQWTVKEAVTFLTTYEDMLTHVLTRMILKINLFSVVERGRGRESI
jgi:hypothetical protein